MLHGTRLTRQNMHIIASEMNISVEELENKRIKAKQNFQDEQDKQWAIAKLGKDEAWYADAIQKIEDIKATLPNDIDYRERTKMLYGWIAESVPNLNLSIPMESDIEYARADCISLILTDPSMYHKITNWD